MHMGERNVCLPEQLCGLPLVVSMSGGKDSTALALALREAELAYRMVFADTGWEAPETYEHLDELRRLLGPIDAVGLPGGMRGEIERQDRFPSRLQRWCTRRLKIEPLRAYHDAICDDTVNVVGVRAGESAARSKLAELEDDDRWGGWVWRPLISWTIEDVLAIHHRHGVPVNPLYRRGHDRVGCFPCIYAAKHEIALTAQHAPERIDEIRELEQAVHGGSATYFQAKTQALGTVPIDRVVTWARTDRGGRQLPLIQNEPDGGCFRWGMCEPPPPGGK